MFLQVQPVLMPEVRELCRRPYYGHPRGCPNWGRRPTCPPGVKLFEQLFNLDFPIYAIYNAFPLGEHMETMRQKHPAWTDHQLRCCLYWQGKARAQLKAFILEFLKEHPGLRITACPEAMGINVTKTMGDAGVHLEWPPTTVAYQVALAGKSKQG